MLVNQFRLLDTDGDGRISRADFVAVAIRICARFGADADAGPGRELHDQYDRFCGPGALTLEEFRERVAHADVRPMAYATVSVCDGDGNGELSAEEFRRLLTTWGLSEGDADTAFQHLDVDLSGHVSAEELTEAMEEFYRGDDPHAPGTWLFGPRETDHRPRARIPYPDPALLPPMVAETLATMPQLNLFRMLAHAESAFLPIVGLGKAVYSDLDLPGDVRELIVLQVACELDATYVWTQHVSAARAERTPRSKIVAVRDGRLDAPCLTEAEQASLAFTAETLHRGRPSDTTFERLRRHLPPRQIVELLVVIGIYAMVARMATALALDADASQGDQVMEYADERGTG